MVQHQVQLADLYHQGVEGEMGMVMMMVIIIMMKYE